MIRISNLSRPINAHLWDVGNISYIDLLEGAGAASNPSYSDGDQPQEVVLPYSSNRRGMPLLGRHVRQQNKTGFIHQDHSKALCPGS